MQAIQQINATTWQTSQRGNCYTVEHHPAAPAYRRWRVYLQNATTRALSMGGASVRDFETVAQLEQHYKALRGLGQLIQLEGAAQ